MESKTLPAEGNKAAQYAALTSNDFTCDLCFEISDVLVGAIISCVIVIEYIYTGVSPTNYIVSYHESISYTM